MTESMKAIMAVAALFVATISNAQEKVILIDRSAEKVEQERMEINNASIYDLKGPYAESLCHFDGNVTGAGYIKSLVRVKSDQVISIAPSLGVEVFGKDVSPSIGLAGYYRNQRISFGIEGTVTREHPDEFSDKQETYWGINGFGDLGYEVYRSCSVEHGMEHSVSFGAFVVAKYSKNSIWLEDVNKNYGFWDNTNSLSWGGGLSATYIYAPCLQRYYHMFQLRVGLDSKLHTKVQGDAQEFSFKGKKWYPLINFSYRIGLGLGKTHSKGYNVSLKNKGMSEKEIEATAGRNK